MLFPLEHQDSCSALPFLLADASASADIRQRTYWETGNRLASPMFLNEHNKASSRRGRRFGRRPPVVLYWPPTTANARQALEQAT